MTRNENVGRHGSTESSTSWRSIRSNETVRAFGRASLPSRGTPVTVQTTKDHFQYVPSSTPRALSSACIVTHGAVARERHARCAETGCAETFVLRLDSCRKASTNLFALAPVYRNRPSFCFASETFVLFFVT